MRLLKVESVFEIILLVIGIFSFAYILSDVELVRAEDVALQCCEETVGGDYCQELLDGDKCKEGSRLSPSRCSGTSYCRLGCCIDEIEGVYSKNTPQLLCKGENVRWVEDANCNLPGARLGCCFLGEQNVFTTEQRCAFLGEKRGLDSSWEVKNEAECLMLAEKQDEGACLLDGCEFTSKADCMQEGGDFYSGLLCTSDELNTSCQPTKKTMCVEGKDGVYFIDSCGNPANIYDASRVDDDAYWQEIISIDESCQTDVSNDCGNCNRFEGICGPGDAKYGDFYCSSTSCMYKGEEYKNGESWCVY
ncbi:MAG: hypothetical protein ACP5D2_04560, partial [Candidatus Nanoarchaeia archaeon]